MSRKKKYASLAEKQEAYRLRKEKGTKASEPNKPCTITVLNFANDLEAAIYMEAEEMLAERRTN